MFEDIVSIDSLMYASRQTLLGKMKHPSVLKYEYSLLSNLYNLHSSLINQTYRPNGYFKKTIHEPKKRIIEAPRYRDRIVHHAVHRRISPIYEKSFIHHSYACRTGKGTHAAVKALRKTLLANQHTYVCKIDISKYYASINHSKLVNILSKKINCPKTLDLLTLIIDSADSGSEHDHLFPANSYYHTKGKRGIPIGNLTSQLFANVYLHEADMYAKQQLKVRHYFRYMDDIIILHHDKKYLQQTKQQLLEFLYEELYLTANPRKIQIHPTKLGVSFVGYVVYPNGHMKLRGSSVRRAKRRLNSQIRRIKSIENINDPCRIEQKQAMVRSFNSWRAHANHAKSSGLIRSQKNKIYQAFGAPSEGGK